MLRVKERHGVIYTLVTQGSVWFRVSEIGGDSKLKRENKSEQGKCGWNSGYSLMVELAPENLETHEKEIGWEGSFLVEFRAGIY